MMHEYFEKTIQEVVMMDDDEFLWLCSRYLHLIELEEARLIQRTNVQQVSYGFPRQA